jgi:hypothetical protein
MIKLKDILSEKRNDKIRVRGLGTYDYRSLKRNVEKKIKDLTKRNKKGNHMGVGKNQFNVLSAMWLALSEYEENN